jgi:prevent-host-death family protein
MKTVNVAELKDKLSAYLDEVEKGEEIVVINRKRPVARVTRIVPEDQNQEEWNLVAEGEMKLPEKTFTSGYLKRFLAARKPEVQKGSSLDALIQDREDEAG